MVVTNAVFGKNGKYFPLLYLMAAFLFAAGTVLIGLGVFGNYQSWEKAVTFLAACYFFYYGIIGISVIGITRNTVKTLSKSDNKIFCTTFGKKDIICSVSDVEALVEKDYPGRNTRFLFPESLEHYSLKHDNETYFLSGAMENLESIIGQ